MHKLIKILVLVFFLTLSCTLQTFTPNAYAQDNAFAVPPNTKLYTDELPPLSPMPEEVSVDDAINRLLSFSEKLGAEKYDRDALIDTLEADPYMAFAFVKDHIRFDPYQGILRGVEGTLGAQAGNTWDQVLLLNDLLNAIGIQTRYMQGTLQEKERQTLLLEAQQQKADITERQILAGLSTELTARLRARAHRDWAGLVTALQPSFNQADLKAPDLSSHVWLQAKIGEEWIDFDPSFMSAKPGETFATDAQLLETIPGDLYHKVRFEVRAEHFKNNALTETSVLDKTFTAKDVQNTPLYLSFVPNEMGMAIGIFTKLSEQKGLLPVLFVNDDSVKGAPVSISTAPNDGAALLGDNQEAKDFFFGETDKSAGAQLTAIYLDVTITAPNEEAGKTERKIILNRLSPSVRFQDNLSAETLEFNHEPVEDILQAIHQISVSTGGTNPYNVAQGMAYALYDVAIWHTQDQSAYAERSMAETLWPLWAMNEKVVLGTELWSDLARLPDHSRAFYIDRPHVYVFTSFATGKDEDRIAYSQIDWLSDQIAPWTASSQSPTALLWYGALQSAYETQVAENAFQGKEAADNILESTSTLSPPPLNLLTTKIPQPGLGLFNDLKNGYVIASSDGTLKAWWKYDPVSGQVKAMIFPALGGSWKGSRRPGGGQHQWSQRSWGIDYETGRSFDPDAPRRRGPKRPKKPSGLQKCKPSAKEYLILLACVSIPVGIITGYFISEMEDAAVTKATETIKSLPPE